MNSEAVRTPIKALKSYFAHWADKDEAAIDGEKEGINAEDKESPFISGSDLQYPTPTFADLEVRACCSSISSLNGSKPNPSGYRSNT